MRISGLELWREVLWSQLEYSSLKQLDIHIAELNVILEAYLNDRYNTFEYE